ncbi:MAG: hypothetical protein F4Y02_11065 [Chloroflexi bacterium]|nr:hypothetical protein [Chloroflexota bacterium]
MEALNTVEDRRNRNGLALCPPSVEPSFFGIDKHAVLDRLSLVVTGTYCEDQQDNDELRFHRLLSPNVLTQTAQLGSQHLQTLEDPPDQKKFNDKRDHRRHAENNPPKQTFNARVS